MLKRWNSITENINLFIHLVKKIVRKVSPHWKKNGRGRPPKHDPEGYLTLLAAKEYDKKSLRGAEVRLSDIICKERVDHSVIAYWEKKPEVTQQITVLVNEVGRLLEQHLTYGFSVIDSTKFTSWLKGEVEVHVVNRITEGTVYPRSISFLTRTVSAPVAEALSQGEKNLYADAWYDVNDAMKVMFQRGYIPIVCPHKERWKGYYRKKARKLYKDPFNKLGYRQRGRGESPFGSLTNAYGDRMKSLGVQATRTRTVARILAYQVRLLIRVTQELLGIIRHSPGMAIFKYCRNQNIGIKY